MSGGTNTKVQILQRFLFYIAVVFGAAWTEQTYQLQEQPFNIANVSVFDKMTEHTYHGLKGIDRSLKC